jgi:MFS family permease
MLTMDRFGRRPVLVFSMFLTAFCSGFALVVPSDWSPHVTVALATIAKFGAAAGWSVLVLQVLS